VKWNHSYPLSALFVEWNRERRVALIDLERITLSKTNVLLASIFGQEGVSDDFAGTIYDETEGNPSYIAVDLSIFLLPSAGLTGLGYVLQPDSQPAGEAAAAQ
jgi:hypothetical protein